MANESEAMERLPEALSKRNKIIGLEDGKTIVVQKWSTTKFISIVDYIMRSLGDIPQASLQKMVVGNDPRESAATFLSVLGSKVTGIVELSVREEDRNKIRDLDAEEFLDVLEGVLELNLTEKLIKKVQSLTAKFRQFGMGNGSNTPSK